MHILVLSSWYPSQKQPLLGVFVKRHALAAAQFHDVTLLHAIADNDLKEGEFRIVKQETNRFREVIVYFGRKAGKTGWRSMMKQNRLLKKHYNFGLNKTIDWFGKPDLLHLNVIWPLGLIALSISSKLKIPMVVTEHWTGYQPEDGRYRGLLMKYLTRKTIRRAKLIMPVSAQLKEAMLKHSLHGNYEVVPNVADENLFNIQPGERKNRLIHVSVLDDAQKNVSGLLKVFSKLRRVHPDLDLVIVGTGPDESKIRRLSNELGLTQRSVEFAGKLEGQELANAIGSSAALILNSRYENQPVVIIEALLCGIPVIAPAVGGIPELINESNGLLFETGNETALEQAITRWYSIQKSYHSEEIRREALKKYCMQAVGEALSRAYLKAAGKC
jgi:glycosyltransferase involved in cell wall biosynthesis